MMLCVGSASDPKVPEGGPAAPSFAHKDPEMSALKLQGTCKRHPYNRGSAESTHV